MEMILSKIDELTQYDHSFINKDSGCYYFAEYPKGSLEENRKNPIYSLIHNLKKSPDREGRPEWRYKLLAIRKCTEVLCKLFETKGNIQEFTLVPIPPSKTKNNPLYDDRMFRILDGLKKHFPHCDVRDMIHTTKDVVASHEADVRPSIEEIKRNYTIDKSLIAGTRNKIILFDDVLTTGAHFCAAKQKILENIPRVSVIGFFIARRTIPPTEFDFDINDLLW